MEKKQAIEKTSAKTAKNAVFAVISQMILTLSPLITTPFVSRELGAENLGIFAHTLVMVQYFQMFANLGVVNYGTRTLAEDRDNILKLSAHFWQIYGLQILNTCIFLFAYLIYVAILPAGSRIIPIIQIMWLLSAFFDINWFFYGIEEIRITAAKDLAVKTVTIVGILLFVRKGHNPLIVYTAIMAGSNLLGLMILLPIMKNYVVWVKPSFSQMISHLKPNLILFVPIVASSIYHSMDKTMLGWMTTYEELGYYYNADKIINVPLQIINALGTAFLPKASELLTSGSRKEAESFMKTSFEITLVLACALAFGIGGCAKDFVPVFFGAGFEPCTLLIYLFVPVLIIKSISTFIRMEYLVPTHHEKIYISSTFAGAAVNILFNAILIPLYGAAGAVIGTLMAELSVMFVQMYGAGKELPIKKMLLSAMSYLIIAVIMFFMMRIVGRISMPVLFKVTVEILTGALAYIVMCLIYWRTLSDNKEILSVLMGLLKKRST